MLFVRTAGFVGTIGSLLFATTLLLSGCKFDTQSKGKNLLANAAASIEGEMDEDASIELELTPDEIKAVELLQVEIVTPPSHGKLSPIVSKTGPDGVQRYAVTYRPEPDFNGNDEVQFRYRNGVENSNVGTIRLKINPVNDAPVALTQSVNAAEETDLEASFLASDIDGDALTFQIITQPTKATATVLDGGRFEYSPNSNAVGADSFTYRVTDPDGLSHQATIQVDLDNVNDAPTASGITLTMRHRSQEILHPVIADVDGDTLSIVVDSQPSPAGSGSAFVSSNQLRFSPTTNPTRRTVTFTYHVTDGTASSPIRTATIEMVPPIHESWAIQSGTELFDLNESTPRQPYSCTANGGLVLSLAQNDSQIVLPAVSQRCQRGSAVINFDAPAVTLNISPYSLTYRSLNTPVGAIPLLNGFYKLDWNSLEAISPSYPGGSYYFASGYETKNPTISYGIHQDNRSVVLRLRLQNGEPN